MYLWPSHSAVYSGDSALMSLNSHSYYYSPQYKIFPGLFSSIEYSFHNFVCHFPILLNQLYFYCFHAILLSSCCVLPHASVRTTTLFFMPENISSWSPSTHLTLAGDLWQLNLVPGTVCSIVVSVFTSKGSSGSGEAIWNRTSLTYKQKGP